MVKTKLNILITAGGTREYIDPVRFIGNRSSGKHDIWNSAIQFILSVRRQNPAIHFANDLAWILEVQHDRRQGIAGTIAGLVNTMNDHQPALLGLDRWCWTNFGPKVKAVWHLYRIVPSPVDQVR